ncbi:MAG: hypothetical protein RBU27_03100 [Bacteroidota bacterium]|nr:hypothetical protein [Bacteroidota bacterium]
MLAAVLLMVAGCCSSSHGTEEFPPLEIHLSSGGGVSGMSAGYSILTDGTITKWTAFPRGRDSEQTVGKLTENEYHTLVSEIHATDFRVLRQQETGNMTASLRITQGDETFTFLWPGLHNKDQDVPPALRPLWRSVWTRIASIESPSDMNGEAGQ